MDHTNVCFDQYQLYYYKHQLPPPYSISLVREKERKKRQKPSIFIYRCKNKLPFVENIKITKSFFYLFLLIKSISDLLNIIYKYFNVIKIFPFILTCNHLSIQGFSIAYSAIESKNETDKLSSRLLCIMHVMLHCDFLFLF
jgi:hypothetical protein